MSIYNLYKINIMNQETPKTSHKFVDSSNNLALQEFGIVQHEARDGPTLDISNEAAAEAIGR